MKLSGVKSAAVHELASESAVATDRQESLITPLTSSVAALLKRDVSAPLKMDGHSHCAYLLNGVVTLHLDDSKGRQKVILYSVPYKEGCYKKLGFVRMLTAMEIFRDRDAELKRGREADVAVPFPHRCVAQLALG